MKHLGIGIRLGLGFAAVVLLLIITGVTGLVNQQRAHLANEANERSHEVLYEAEALLVALVNIETGQRGFLLGGEDRYLEPYRDGQVEFERHMERARELAAGSPDLQADLESLEQQYNTWLEAAVQPLIDARRDAGNDAERLRDIAGRIDSGRAGMDDMRELLVDIEARERNVLQRRAEQMDEARSTALWTVSGVMVLGVLISLAAGFLITRSVVRPLNEAVEAAEAIAGGDLRGDVAHDRDDEVGKLLQAQSRMTAGLGKMIRGIDESADQLASASEQLTVTSESTRRGAEQQKLETSQVATAINEMASTVQEVSRNTQETATAAREASEKADEGRAAMQRSADGIAQLASEVEEAGGVIARLEQRSESIGQVLDVIRGIAEQTNLLALNAAIEAARAGDQGRGFSVVADEVRTLAGNTQKSVGDIESIVEDFQSGTREAVGAMDRGRRSAEENVRESEGTRQMLDAIGSAVASIHDMATQVASAVEEQSAVAEDINRNITTIDSVAEETGASIAEASDASAELSRLASELQGMVRKFQVN